MITPKKQNASTYVEAQTMNHCLRNLGIDTVGNILLLLGFAGILCFFLFSNVKQIGKIFAEEGKKEKSIGEVLVATENTFRESIYQRKAYIDLYGIALKTTNQKIIGDFEFVKDDHNIIQRFATQTDITGFTEDMMLLQEVAKKQNIPLVYLQIPDKTKYLFLAQSEKYAFNGQLSQKVGQIMEEKGVECIDYEEEMERDPLAPTFDKFFLKTDVHCSTYAEFWMAKRLVEHLSENYNLKFYNMEQIFDLNQYTVNSYPFVGNTARSAGRFFAGSDVFEIYVPRFNTNITIKNPPEEEERSGNFEEVILNGYEQRENIDRYTYWITNYGNYPSPFYKYINMKASEKAPRLLIISDSIFMRGFSYLSLACREITILDPRYFKENNYLVGLLAVEQYDGIIVVGSSENFFRSHFQAQDQLPNLPQKPMISEAEYGQWLGNRGIWMDKCNGEKPASQGELRIDPSRQIVELVGWAADFCNEKPLSSLYITVGDIVMQCQYGIERQGFVDHFKKEEMLQVGFKIFIPTEILQKENAEEIMFFGVSADGEILYEPVAYQINYE